MTLTIISIQHRIQKISISREEIQHHIKSLFNEKASCPVFFTNEPFIFCGDKIVDGLCILYNSILRHAHVQSWYM